MSLIFECSIYIHTIIYNKINFTICASVFLSYPGQGLFIQIASDYICSGEQTDKKMGQGKVSLVIHRDSRVYNFILEVN